VRHDRTERSAAADRTEATLANEPTEKADKNDPIEPIERTDPTEPIERIEPREPTHRIEFSDLIDSNELRQVVTSPIMVHQPAPHRMAPDQWSRAIRRRSLSGAEGTRTPDPLHAMEVRYQLRHSPARLIVWCPAVGTG
jgi:hypothetical protein